MKGLAVLWQLIGRLTDRQLESRTSGLACLGLEVGGVIVAGLAPYLLKLVVDDVAARQAHGWSGYGLVAIFIAAWTAPSLLSALRAVYSSRINARLAASLASGAVRGFLSDEVWRGTESGKVQSLIERLPYNLTIVVDGLVWRTAPIALQLVVGLTVVLLLTDGKFVLALAVVAAGFVGVSWLGIRWQASAAKTFNLAATACGALVGDILRNPRRIVSNGAIALEVTGVGCAYSDREAAEGRVGWSLVGLSAAQWAVTAVGLTVVFTMAAADAENGRISVSGFVLLQAYALRLLLPLAGIGFILSQSASALDSLAEVLALQPAVSPVTLQAAPDAVRPASHVEVRNLSFGYPGGRGGVSGVSVDFPPGSFSVIVGRNGAGKSTFAQLLAGLLRADAGAVTYGGQRIDQVPEADRHERVLYVPQRVSLLNRDLRSNLFYPPSKLSEADAVHRLTAWEFQADGQPVDFAVAVGEGGEALSGGQVQKLELARLLGVEVPCLILDESTSALNPAIEARIVADLRREIGTRTTLIFVAHRLELAKAADQVLWMEAGCLRAIGSHDELIAGRPEYRELWQL